MDWRERIRALNEAGQANFRIALAMLLLGGAVLFGGYDFVRQWSALAPELAIVTVIWTIAGVAICVSAVLLLSQIRKTKPVWFGATFAAVAGATLSYGVLGRIIPCPGPTCVLSRLVAAAGLIFFSIVVPAVAVRNSKGSIRGL